MARGCKAGKGAEAWPRACEESREFMLTWGSGRSCRPRVRAGMSFCREVGLFRARDASRNEIGTCGYENRAIAARPGSRRTKPASVRKRTLPPSPGARLWQRLVGTTIEAI